jgi:flagellar basal body P-ring formation protein FlgA
MRIAALIAVFASLARAGCLAVPADRITVGDLATALPIFQALEPTTPFGFAPFPGTQRIVSAHELVLLAQQHNLSPDGLTASLCIERQVQPISADDLKSALLTAIGIPEANLELVEFSSQPVPPGRFEFKRSGLGTPGPADALVIWRGRLLYDGRHSISIWAKVRVTVNARRFVAAEAIAAGSVIRAEQVKEIESAQFPFSEPVPAAIGEIAGKVARRSLASGERIVTRSLEQPKDVRPGETVHVQVLDGATALSFDAVAEGGGRAGDSIWVHNPTGGKKFKAVIEKSGKVVVRTSGD